jgi:uncharacterized protein YerC
MTGDVRHASIPANSAPRRNSNRQCFHTICWMYEVQDLAPRRRVVEILKPYPMVPVAGEAVGQDIPSHRNYPWLLADETTSDLHMNPKLRQRPIAQVASAAFYGEEVRSSSAASLPTSNATFDPMCQELYHFLKDQCTAAERCVKHEITRLPARIRSDRCLGPAQPTRKFRQGDDQ